MTTYRDITLAILVGGRGRRMGGRDKALLEIEGRPFAVRLIENLREAVSCILLAGRPDQSYDELGVASVADRREDAGPLAGIEAALLACATPWCFVVSVDTPRVDHEILSTLADARTGAVDVVAASTAGVVQPLCALYRKTLAGEVSDALERGERAVFKLLDRVRCRKVALTGRAADRFVNVNAPEDLARVQAAYD